MTGRQKFWRYIGYGALGICITCFALTAISETMRNVGLLPTLTPRPTATATLTPTITLTPSITPIPSDTPVPTETPTPTITPTPTPDVGSEAAAEVMCERFVTDRLKSPSTADFGGFLENRTKAIFFDIDTVADLGIDTTDLHNIGVWYVTGSVDAQNSFGAMIRSEFSCVLDYNVGTQEWFLLDISIE